MNSNYKLDISYIAGIFDVKGIIKRSKKTKWHWKMEITMTDRNVMELIHETLECGTLREKKVMGKKQWRWHCLNKDCFFVARLLWPHVMVKLHKIEQIIDHYEPDIQELNNNIINLALERERKRK